MSENNSKPSPSLVLSIGHQANGIAAQAQTIFLRSNPWRAHQAKFLSLSLGQQGGFDWNPTRPTKAAKINKQTRAQVASGMLKSSDVWQAQLDDALHSLRIHEPGVAEKSALALHVILVSNLTDPFSAALLPVLVSLQSLLAREPYCQVSLLLSVADFSNPKKQENALACLAVGLDDLQSFFAPQSALFTAVCHSLGVAPAITIQPQTYLFDRYKEGVWEVGTEPELSLLVSNFLLALLNSEPGIFAPAHRQDTHLALLGAGSTSLVYNPAELQEACAASLGAETLQSEFGADISPDLRDIHTVVEKSASMYGDLTDWLTRLLAETPFSPRVGKYPTLDIHFSDLSFDNLPLEEWSYAVSGHEKYFGEKVFPASKESLKENAGLLAEELLGQQLDMLETLPLQIELYPGGLQAALKVMDLLRGGLQERLQSSPQPGDTDVSEQALHGRLEDHLKLLDDAVQALPAAPTWFRYIPFPANRLARFLFALLYQRRELARLMILRQNALRAAELKYAALMESETRQQIQGLSQKLIDALDQVSKKVQSLQVVMQDAELRLRKRAELALQSDSPFRPSALDQAAYEWAYMRGTKPTDEIRPLWMEQEGFLDEWKSLDAKKTESVLMTLGRSLYQFVWEISLDEILSRRSETDLQPIWDVLSQGAAPLLRPDFDLAGADGQAFQTQFFICQSARTTCFAPFLRVPLAEWQAHSAGDPYLAFCVRLRQGLTLSAIGGSPAQARRVFDKLSEAEREQFGLGIGQECEK
jgi:hypothetical protein